MSLVFTPPLGGKLNETVFNEKQISEPWGATLSGTESGPWPVTSNDQGPPHKHKTMNASIETIDGKVTLTVFYDPVLRDWDEAIAAGLASYGLKEGQVTILAVPSKTIHPHERQAERF